MKFDPTAYPLVYAPNIALDTPVEPFPEGETEYREQVSKYMQDKCTELRGVGLAANQISLNAAVFVTHVQKDMVTMFNPQVHQVSENKVLMSEGCLSEPGLNLKVSRPDMILVSWENEQGERRQANLFGMDARVFLHEFDHLQGIMFTDRVGKPKLDMARKKQNKRYQSAAARLIAQNA